ncbi:MAG: hypothetical protein V4721_06735 [Bacteroidota bacterium]
MLVLLFGTSCVGKTTLIKELVKKHLFKYITWYTTRPVRDGDLGRCCVSSKEFRLLESENRFMLINNSYGYLYGMPRDSIQSSIKDEKYFIADFRIKDVHLFDAIDCIKIIVLPENEAQLIRQIHLADRFEREEAILTDYRENLNSKRLKKYILHDCYVYVNIYDENNRNANLLNNLIKQIKKDSLRKVQSTYY